MKLGTLLTLAAALAVAPAYPQEEDEAEAAPASTTTQGSEQLGSLGAAFDALSVEWQPGEDK